MMKKLTYILPLLAIIAGMILPYIDIAEAKQPDDLYAAYVGVKQVVDNNVDVTYTGRHYADIEGNMQYEYVARVDQAPIYNSNGLPVDCSWHYVAPQPIYEQITSYKEGQEAKVAGYNPAYYEVTGNIFSARADGTTLTTTYQGQTMSWNPVVMVDSKEYVAKGNPIVLPVDPINSNYRNNTLEWDYGVCVRRVRVIEGLIQETWIFDKDPKGTVWIKDNTQKSVGFKWAVAPYAFDANNTPIIINQYKQVMASEFDKATYPVTIDPTEVFVTSASDGDVYYQVEAAYATIQAYSSGSIEDVLNYLQVGQQYLWIPPDHAFNGVWRGFLFFDTSAIPDSATITASNVSLFGAVDTSTTNFNITVTNGQPTYPHNPLVAGDYDCTHYAGVGGSINTSSFITSGYNNISLNSSGISWINVAGTTKLTLRSSRDISIVAPSGDEYITIWCYEKGVGYRPYLEVTYFAAGAPTITTNPGTYITRTSARMNGYIDADGGEASNSSFNYLSWYNSTWKDCIEFTINASYVDADLTNFPVLITGAQLNTTDTDFWTTVLANGSDILFTDVNGTKLNRELVSIDRANFALECYVNVTAVDDTANTRIYMYYNNSAGLETNSTATWDANYIAVWHMGDLNTSAISDSTVNAQTGRKKGANEPLEAVGNFGGDEAQYFDGVDDYINVSHNANQLLTTGGTIFAVISPITYGSSDAGRIIGKDENSNMLNGYGYTLQTSNRYYFKINAGTAVSSATNRYVLNDSNWYQGAVSWNSSGYVQHYASGLPTGTLTLSADPAGITSILNLCIGRSATVATGRFFNGSISEIRISNISRSASWINASYYSLMLPTSFCPVTDVFTSTANQSKNTGDSFYSDATGLAPHLYGYKAEATNSYGTAWGHWIFFNTSVVLQSPSNGLCNPTSSTIELTWTKGGNSSHTYIRYKMGGYPTGTGDGNLLCNTSDVGYTHLGLLSGTTYYYRLWGEDGGIYSTSNTTIMCTTLAGAGPSLTPGSPSEPDTWTDTTNGSTISNLPIYDIGNSFFDTFQLPHNTGWMAAALSFVMVSGFIIYSRSKNLLVAILMVMVLSIILSVIGLLPMWAVYCFAITSLGMSWKELR